MKYRCDHVHLRSQDPIAAARFYVDALGATETGRVGAPDVTRVLLDLGGLAVFIERAAEGIGPSPEPPYLGLEHLGLAVDDIDAAMADLRGRGVKIVMDVKEVRPGLRIAFIDGPDAVRIEVLERT
jgi:lactoylglutathione lyase